MITLQADTLEVIDFHQKVIEFFMSGRNSQQMLEEGNQYGGRTVQPRWEFYWRRNEGMRLIILSSTSDRNKLLTIFIYLTND